MPMTFEKWTKLGFDTWALTYEASGVIASRLARIARGDTAAMVESQLMVTEKIASATALMAMAMTGGLGSTPYSSASRTVAHYRKAVAKNERRLRG